MTLSSFIRQVLPAYPVFLVPRRSTLTKTGPNEQDAGRGRFKIWPAPGDEPDGSDIEIIVGNCTGKQSRCPPTRHYSILCRIRADAVRDAVYTRVKCVAPRLLRLYATPCVWMAASNDA